MGPAERGEATQSPYDHFARHYDDWTGSGGEDVEFYVEQARKSGGMVVELGVGSGRVAIPTARAGVRVIGIDSAAGMLKVCEQRAEQGGVSGLIDLRIGDFRAPPVTERATLVTCPFRSMMHLESDRDRRKTLASVFALLSPGGRFIFDVFTPTEAHDDPTRGTWRERAPGIRERIEFDWERRVMHVFLESEAGVTELRLAWLEREEWRSLLEGSGFDVFACYGWFDLRACSPGAPHSVWIALRGT